FEEDPRRDGTREPDTLGAPDPLLHAGRAVLAGPEPASLAVRGLGILHQGLAIVLPPRVAADAHHHHEQNDRTDHDLSDFQPGRHELAARFSIASFYARNMIRAARRSSPGGRGNRPANCAAHPAVSSWIRTTPLLCVRKGAMSLVGRFCCKSLRAGSV